MLERNIKTRVLSETDFVLFPFATTTIVDVYISRRYRTSVSNVRRETADHKTGQVDYGTELGCRFFVGFVFFLKFCFFFLTSTVNKRCFIDESGLRTAYTSFRISGVSPTVKRAGKASLQRRGTSVGQEGRAG